MRAQVVSGLQTGWEFPNLLYTAGVNLCRSALDRLSASTSSAGDRAAALSSATTLASWVASNAAMFAAEAMSSACFKRSRALPVEKRNICLSSFPPLLRFRVIRSPAPLAYAPSRSISFASTDHCFANVMKDCCVTPVELRASRSASTAISLTGDLLPLYRAPKRSSVVTHEISW